MADLAFHTLNLLKALILFNLLHIFNSPLNKVTKTAYLVSFSKIVDDLIQSFYFRHYHWRFKVALRRQLFRFERFLHLDAFQFDSEVCNSLHLLRLYIMDGFIVHLDCLLLFFRLN